MGCLWCQYSHYTQAAAYKTHLPLCQRALGFLLEETCSHISLVHCTVGKDVVGWYCKKTCTGSSSPSSKFIWWLWFSMGLCPNYGQLESLDMRLAHITEGWSIYVEQVAPATLILLFQWFGVSSGLPPLSLVTLQWFCLWETSPLLTWGMQTALGWVFYVHKLKPFNYQQQQRGKS